MSSSVLGFQVNEAETLFSKGAGCMLSVPCVCWVVAFFIAGLPALSIAPGTWELLNSYWTRTCEFLAAFQGASASDFYPPVHCIHITRRLFPRQHADNVSTSILYSQTFSSCAFPTWHIRPSLLRTLGHIRCGLDFALQPCHSRLPSWTNPVANMTSTSQYICSPAFASQGHSSYAPFAWNPCPPLGLRCPSPWCLTYSLSPLSSGNLFILHTPS